MSNQQLWTLTKFRSCRRNVPERTSGRQRWAFWHIALIRCRLTSGRQRWAFWHIALIRCRHRRQTSSTALWMQRRRLTENFLWKEHQDIYPNCAAVARRYHVIPASSAASERLFSATRRLVDTERLCVLLECVESLVFPYQNEWLLLLLWFCWTSLRIWCVFNVLCSLIGCCDCTGLVLGSIVFVCSLGLVFICADDS